MRPIKKIIIHCSDSNWGNAATINQWHLERGFDKIGYHYVILNAYPEYRNIKEREPRLVSDGLIEYGRSISEIGAHCVGQNEDSIGICLIGENIFSSVQIEALISITHKLMQEYKLKIKDVYGHYEFNPIKSCPNINMDWLRIKLGNVRQ